MLQFDISGKYFRKELQHENIKIISVTLQKLKFEISDKDNNDEQ